MHPISFVKNKNHHAHLLCFGVLQRVIAEDNLVAVHSHLRRNAEDRGRVVIDIFRVEQGKIVEHWDVFQPVPETAAKNNGMF